MQVHRAISQIGAIYLFWFVRDMLFYCVRLSKPVSGIPQCTSRYPTMHHFVTEMCMCAHFCYKMVLCVISSKYIMGMICEWFENVFVQSVRRQQYLNMKWNVISISIDKTMSYNCENVISFNVFLFWYPNYMELAIRGRESVFVIVIVIAIVIVIVVVIVLLLLLLLLLLCYCYCYCYCYFHRWCYHYH